MSRCSTSTGGPVPAPRNRKATPATGTFSELHATGIVLTAVPPILGGATACRTLPYITSHALEASGVMCLTGEGRSVTADGSAERAPEVVSMITDIASYLRFFDSVRRRTERDVAALPPEAAAWKPPITTGEGAGWSIGDIVAHIGGSRLYFASAYRGEGWISSKAEIDRADQRT